MIARLISRHTIAHIMFFGLLVFIACIVIYYMEMMPQPFHLVITVIFKGDNKSESKSSHVSFSWPRDVRG